MMMNLCRILRPAGRIVRATRGLLIILSGLAVIGTITFIHQLEGPPKSAVSGHSAQRVLQQLDSGTACRNCSSPVVDAGGTVVQQQPQQQQQQQQQQLKDPDVAAAVAAAGEVLSPEEALPEEMAPDQEPPAIPTQPKVVEQPPAKAEPLPVDPPHQEEHAQQQESLLKVVDESRQQQNEINPLKPPPPVADAGKPSDNMSRSLLDVKVQPQVTKTQVHPPTTTTAAVRTAKIQGVHLKALKGVAKAGGPASSGPAPAPAPPKEYENPSVVTRTLYQSGHRLPPKDICPNQGSGMKLLILVTTAPAHAKQREAVRGTWGHVAFRRDVGFAFMVGTSKNPHENRLVEEENLLYGDIIQGNFIDTYNNLTLKTISMLEWSFVYCGRVQYLLKTDDDMYIHMPVLLSLLDRPTAPKRRTIMGKVAKKWKPIRNTTSKYYISPAQFKNPMYPDFNTGPAYLVTNDIFDQLYQASLNGIFFKLEDVYVTGMMASQLRIAHVDYPQFFNRRLKLDTCAVNKLASVHMVKTFEMYDLWKRLSDGLTKCN